MPLSVGSNPSLRTMALSKEDQELIFETEEKLLRNVDRKNWPEGPWDKEPDHLEWTTQVGLPAVLQRNSLGSLCGYVGVPPSHPAYQTGYDDVTGYDDMGVSVHGGLTYSEPEAPYSHQTGFWWFGFDAGHHGDISPSMLGLLGSSSQDGSYRDVSYIKRECEDLARQLYLWDLQKLGETPDSSGG